MSRNWRECTEENDEVHQSVCPMTLQKFKPGGYGIQVVPSPQHQHVPGVREEYTGCFRTGWWWGDFLNKAETWWSLFPAKSIRNRDARNVVFVVRLYVIKFWQASQMPHFMKIPCYIRTNGEADTAKLMGLFPPQFFISNALKIYWCWVEVQFAYRADSLSGDHAYSASVLIFFYVQAIAPKSATTLRTPVHVSRIQVWEEDTIKIDLQEVRWRGHGLDWSDSGYGQVAGSFDAVMNLRVP